MRNLKRALSLALSSVMLLGMMVVGTSAASYPDVDAQDNLEAIEVLDILGVMSGDENGKFNPDAKITRNEMAVVMTHLLKLNAGGTSPFTDVPSWAQPYVAACYANGVTAGTGANTYGGSNNVTAVEAALMVMKSLGYFGYQGEFADNWSLAVVKQATKINLFNGIDAAATDAITRSEAAQMCLNALEATVTVVTEEGGLAVDGNGISVNVKPSYSYASAKNTDFDYCGRSLIDGTMQLCEKLYGEKLHKDISGDKADKFGRPANEWTYSGKAVTTPKAADAVYTAEVSAKTLYNDLSLSDAETAKVYTDSQTSKSNFTVTKTGTDADKKIGGNGTLVEAYKIMKNDGTLESVKLVVVNTYAGEITKVTPAKDGDAATVKVENVTNAYETEGYEKGDIVVYTIADGDIQSMALATKVEAAEVTKVTGDTSFVAGGTTYKYGEKIDENSDILKASDVGSTQDLYLDANGYVVYIKEFEGSSDYAYVLKTGSESGRFDTTFYAQLLTADGSVVEAQVKKVTVNGSAVDATEGNVEGLKGDIVKYSKNSKGEYTLTTMTDSAAAAVGKIDVNKGEAKMTLGDKDVFANSKTLFLVQNGEGDKATYTAYTGYANVANLTASQGTALVYSESSQATVVFVKGVAAAGDNQLVYVLHDKVTVVNDADAGKYYEYKAVEDGEITTINLDSEISADTIFSNLVKDDYKVVDVNASTTYSNKTTDDSFAVADQLKGEIKNDVITLKTNGTYAISSDVAVYKVLTDKIEAASVSDLAGTESVTVVVENAEVVAIFWDAK